MLIARGTVSGPRRVSFRSYFGFGSLPNADSYTGNRWFLEGKDGLGAVSDFWGRYGSCQNLSGQVDAIRGEPEASGLNSTERQLAGRLNQLLKDAAANYEWDCNPCGFFFGRSSARQRTLDSLLASIGSALNDYNAQVSAGLSGTRAAIEERNRRIAAENAAAADAERARQEAATAEADRATAELLLKTAQTQKATLLERQDTAAEAVNLVKAQAAAMVQLKAAQPDSGSFSTASMNLPVVGSLLAAAGIGIYMFMSRPGRRSRR